MATSDNAGPAKRKCVGCGVELPPNASPELCPKCLLKLAMETQPGPGPGGTVALPGSGGKSRGLPQPGEQFGHYTILRALGAGGMGAVYDAEDHESGRRVALKVLSHRLDSPDARERFFREGRLAASINHPNSVYIFGTEEVGGTPVITMELVSGGTLQERVRARGPLPIGEAVDAVLQIIEGLEAAQRVGILHRDVKPSNCYVGEDGAVKVGDFGLSISTGVRTEPALTETGAFLGTPAFCSPEQLRGEELNARSDMYSVGTTLFYLLTGRTPFEAKNMVQMLATVFEQRAPSPRQFRPEISKGLAKVVLRCLEKQPGDRYKSYGDLAQALAPYTSTASTPATLGLRFLAGLVDMTIISLVTGATNLFAFGGVMGFMDEAIRLSPKMIVCLLGWVFLTTLYYGVCEGVWGASLGKLLCRVRVVGPDRNPPGVTRAWLRAVIFIVPPFAPYWLAFGANPKAYFSTPPWEQTLIGLFAYVVMALLFVTARRRNGFAAVQDLLTGTRVVSRAAVIMRPVLMAAEAPPPASGSAINIGPYHVLQALSEAEGMKWFLAYDLKLLRKVWVRVVPPGSEPVPPAVRNLGRVGRLRWLTSKRSTEENWDAFEGLNGQPFLDLIRGPQRWREVRYWLHDLAAEISAAEKDGTLPELALDRLWITGEGRAKLLDFPAPGFGSYSPAMPANSRAAALQRPNEFLGNVAAAALAGGTVGAQSSAGDVAVPLPLHARDFLKRLAQMSGADAIVAALKPLLSRTAAVSRLRRVALLTGCIAFPLMACGGGFFAVGLMKEMTRRAPGAMDLNTLLQMRTWSRKTQLPTDRLIEIYISHHFRGLITNDSAWSSPFVLAMIKGESRKFAEKSVADFPAPTSAEIAEADKALEKRLPKQDLFTRKPSPAIPVLVLATMLGFYVACPAVVAALLFRGGLVLLVAGVTYVRRDGLQASRLRLFWRSLVTWAPAAVLFVVAVAGMAKNLTWQPWLAMALIALVAAVSVALPVRGLQDRLAGTWPVPR
jgi:eukaryotic-like serine/threonine-protein kinase